MSTLLQKQLRHLQPSKLTLWVRPQLEQFCRERVVPRLNVPTEIYTPLPDELVMLVNGGRFSTSACVGSEAGPKRGARSFQH